MKEMFLSLAIVLAQWNAEQSQVRLDALRAALHPLVGRIT
jgi:hypothetical protein